MRAQEIGDVQTAVANAAKGFGVPLYLSERKILLGVIDLALVNLAMMGLGALRLHEPWGSTAILRHPFWYVLLSATWLVVALLLDAYNLRRASAPATGMLLGAGAALLVGLVYLSIPYVTPPLLASRLSAFGFLLAAGGTIGLWRGVYATVLSQQPFRSRVLIVGAGGSGQTILEAIHTHAPAEYQVLGFVDDDPVKQGTVIDGVPLLGTRRDLWRVVERIGATEVIVAITHADRMDAELFQAVMDCRERGIQVTQMTALYEQLTGRIAVEHVGRNLHVILPLSPSPTRLYFTIKWTLDMVVGVLGLVATSVLFPLVALGLRIEDGGSLFYHQVRLGRGGRPFTLTKFRTMSADAESSGPQWAQERDARVTRVGRILRGLHLDEVPQAISILRGDSSFVGPRPERPEFVAHLERQIPFYRARHAVKPGITGWAQVNYPYGASVEDALVKLQYDLYYIKHQSLWLDLLILIKTTGLVLTFRGR